MDPGYSLQDVVWCRLFSMSSLSPFWTPLYTKHKIVPFKLRFLSTTICKKHSSKLRERYCENVIFIFVCSVPLLWQFLLFELFSLSFKYIVTLFSFMLSSFSFNNPDLYISCPFYRAYYIYNLFIKLYFNSPFFYSSCI